jgi:putative ABC transport system substrate-binding protein
MKRRDFITLLGGAVAAWPLAARAQQRTMPVIGFLASAAPELYTSRLRAFRRGLSEAGYVEGRNVAIEYRWAHDQYGRLPELAADFVRRQVSVIAAAGTAATWAAKAATTSVPIVFMMGADPVGAGFVANLSRPGGNLTGATILAVELGAKLLEVLHELLPNADVVAALVNPASPNAETTLRELRVAANTLGLQIYALHASTGSDLILAFSNMAQRKAAGLVIAPDAFLNSRSEELAALALRHAVPAIFNTHEFVAAGGLMSYGASVTDAYRLGGDYAGRILKGEKPADLPVQQSTKVELFLNLKTAKALGLTVPLPLLGRADEVIE